MARLLLTAMLATALLLPASADAHGRRPEHHASNASNTSNTSHRQSSARALALEQLAGQGPVVLATAVAESYWHAVPCAGQITVLTNLPVPSSLEPTTDGWVTFDSSLGANDLQAPASTYTQCTISLAHWQWPTRKSMRNDWNMFCLTMTHEVGHLLGHKHTLIPGSVMAPVFVNESNVPRICRATRPPTEAVVSRSRGR
jgi:hypothetical protein